MIDRLAPPGSTEYLGLLSVLLIARGADFFSTWIATPTLALEANPLARKMGWKWGLAVNLVFCLAVAAWPLPAIILATTSLLVASRNLQLAWLMRSLGEQGYRTWIIQQISRANTKIYLACIVGQTLLTGSIGFVLIRYSQQVMVPFAIGVGIVTYAGAVTLFTLMALWRLRRDQTSV